MYQMKPGILVRVSIAEIKHHDKKASWRKSFISFICPGDSPSLRTVMVEIKSGTLRPQN